MKQMLLQYTSKQLIVCGDLHGEFNLLRFIIKSNEFKDSVIVIAGDCGFGFEKLAYYMNIYNKMKKLLEERNILVLFVRGNHDDPAYFNNKMINFEYFKTIPDYEVLSFSDGFNVLCVGGATSIDRKWRIHKQEDAIYRKLYWEDESPVYNNGALDTIKANGINVDMVIAHSSPKFAPLHTKEGIEMFLLDDDLLESDIESERTILTLVYNHLINDGHKLKYWIYGHFHQHSRFISIENVKFVMLDIFRTRNNSFESFVINNIDIE